MLPPRTVKEVLAGPVGEPRRADRTAVKDIDREPEGIAAQLNTSARTIFRARAWIVANDAELWGKLRPRVGGLGYDPPRGKRT